MLCDLRMKLLMIRQKIPPTLITIEATRQSDRPVKGIGVEEIQDYSRGTLKKIVYLLAHFCELYFPIG